MAVRRFIASGLLGIACQMAGSMALPAHAADKAFGEYLAGECVTCHLPSGRQVGGIPAIAGMPEISFMALMESYARRERDNRKESVQKRGYPKAKSSSGSNHFVESG